MWPPVSSREDESDELPEIDDEEEQENYDNNWSVLDEEAGHHLETDVDMDNGLHESQSGYEGIGGDNEWPDSAESDQDENCLIGEEADSFWTSTRRARNEPIITPRPKIGIRSKPAYQGILGNDVLEKSAASSATHWPLQKRPSPANSNIRTSGLALPRATTMLPIGARIKPSDQKMSNDGTSMSRSLSSSGYGESSKWAKNVAPSRSSTLSSNFVPPRSKASGLAPTAVVINRQSEAYRSRSPRATSSVNVGRGQGPSGRMCRNGVECTREDCWFMHPPGRLQPKPLPTDGSNVIFVGRIYKEVTQEQFADFFKQFGAVVSAKIKEDYDGRTRGFGFVTFADAAAAERAVSSGHDTWDIKRKRDMD